MKKLVLITGIFVFTICNLYAQDDKDFVKNKTSFGIKGGLNFTYSTSTGNENLTDFDFYGGLFSETRFAKKWSFQSELIYSTTLGHRFIEVPLTFKYHITDKWTVFAGPSLDFSMNNDRNINDRQIEPLGLSMVVGTQYNLSKKLFIEARANFAITNQINTPYNNPTDSFFRNTFRMGVGYRF